MKAFAFLLPLAFSLSLSALAQRQVERLDRGVVAIKQSSDKVFISWRFFATDPDDIAFNVYRENSSGASTKLNANPIADRTNFVWATQGAASGVASRFYVKPVIDGMEGEENGSWSLPANAGAHRIVKDISYAAIPDKPDTVKMDMKFCWPADLDGDGRYDFVIDRQNYGAMVEDEADSDNSDYISPKVEAYSADGQFLWRIDMGYNVKICEGHNDMVTAFDMDGDNHAEVLMAVSEGTTFADGTVITGADGQAKDYRNIAGSAPQWVAIVNGQTGNLIDTVSLPLAAEIVTQRSDKWKNINGHFIIAYLNGIRPSLVYQHKNRQTSGQFTGGYTAWHFANNQLVEDWHCRFQKEDTEYESHQVRAADVDGDGKDEFVEISYVVDDNGDFLYYAKDVYHGDRHCLTDIDPDKPGLEQFYIQQTNIIGMGLFDALNGDIVKAFYMGAVADVGRGVCAAFDPTRRGLQLFSTMNEKQMYDCKGNIIAGAEGNFPGEALWWGPDLVRWEVVPIGGTGGSMALEKYNTSTKVFERVTPNLYNEKSANYLKSFYGGRAAFWGDILGDWREELVCPRSDGTGFGILSTWEPTDKRIYCLMQNPAYRDQTTARGYYQTADVDFYMAADMPKPPVAPVQTADEYVTSASLSTALNSKSAMLDIRNPNSSISVNGNVSPSRLWLMNPKGRNFTFEGTGKLTGATDVVKSMQGDVVFSGNYDYTGATRVSEGRLFVNGTLASHVTVNARGMLGGSGTLNGGVTFEAGLNVEGGRIEPGNGDALDTLTIVGNVAFPGRNNLAFDVDQTKPQKNDVLKVQGNFAVSGNNHSIIINALTELQPDTLTLVIVTGTNTAAAANFTVAGLDGVPYNLVFEDSKIKLVLQESRTAGSVAWRGDKSSAWDYQTKNFRYNNAESVFVPGDTVLFDDNATNQSVTIAAMLPAASTTVSTASTYIFGGAGGISGAGFLKKEGSGTLKINTTNAYTGTTQILGGTVEAVTVGNAGAESSLGAGNSLQISDATLKLSGISASDRAVSLSGSVTIDLASASASLALVGNVSGSTCNIVKDGEGTLNFQGANSFNNFTIKAGTVALGSVAANSQSLGSAKITMEGGKLQMYDSNSGSPTFSNEIIVPEGKNAVWNLPKRWTFSNKLTGGGTITINAPYVRNDFNGDWSGFAGKINFTGSDIRLNNALARNLPNAEVNLGSGTKLYVASNGSGEASAGQAITFGALSGSGGISGKNSLTIGAKNISTTYSGVISSGSGKLTKTGTATLTLSGNNAYTGGTEVSEGILAVANTEGSATGTGSVVVKSNSELNGSGIIGGSVTIAAQAVIKPGSHEVSTPGTLRLKQNLTLNGMLKVSADNVSGTSDKLIVEGNAAISGSLTVVQSTLAPAVFPLGYRIDLLDVGGSTTGKFNTLTLPPVAEGAVWNTDSLYLTGVLKVAIGTNSPDTTDIPDIPDISDTPDTPDTPDTTHVPDVPGISDTATTGINHLSANKDFKIYPNPVNDYITVICKTKKRVSIQIIDLLGRVFIIQSVVSGEKINVSVLPKGIYFVKRSDGIAGFDKIIKN